MNIWRTEKLRYFIKMSQDKLSSYMLTYVNG